MNTWIFVFYGFILWLVIGYLLLDTYVNKYYKKIGLEDVMTELMEDNPGYADDVYSISYILLGCLFGIPVAILITAYRIEKFIRIKKMRRELTVFMKLGGCSEKGIKETLELFDAKMH